MTPTNLIVGKLVEYRVRHRYHRGRVLAVSADLTTLMVDLTHRQINEDADWIEVHICDYSRGLETIDTTRCTIVPLTPLPGGGLFRIEHKAPTNG